MSFAKQFHPPVPIQKKKNAGLPLPWNYLKTPTLSQSRQSHYRSHNHLHQAYLIQHEQYTNLRR